jgi:hypothetical protein
MIKEKQQMDDEEIINEVKRLDNPGGEAFLASTNKDFMYGQLHVVQFKKEYGDISTKYFYENLVDLDENPFAPNSRAFSSMHDFIAWINIEYEKIDRRAYALARMNVDEHRSYFLSFLDRFYDVRFVSGLIGVGIAATICFLAISDLRFQQANRTSGENDPIELVKIPEPLSLALSSIIGFYFGSAVGKSSNGDKRSDGE